MTQRIPWTDLPPHRAWLATECDRLLSFGVRLPHPRGGAAWLDDDGAPDLGRPLHTWITARMVHVYSLGVLLGRPGAAQLADAALDGLTGPLHDDAHGGWYPAVDADGAPAPGKACYDHAFVLLAASSAALAGRPGAQDLLSRARDTFLERFWDPGVGMCVDSWDTAWTAVDPYRGLNGNMHAVEAMLAAGDVLGDPAWHVRALQVARRVVQAARENRWRIPEHYDSAWTPDLEFHRDRPDDPFTPFGATVGHGLEWSRLLLHLEAAGLRVGAEVDGLLDAAARLFGRAVADGWAVDGAAGFVYTTDWDGTPVVRERMHWVAAEAIAAAAALHARTADPRYAELYARWWDYVATHVIDVERGSWRHQLDEQNRPAATVWSGKADLYHAVQATLLPRLPLAPSLASAVAAGALR